jgi:hypothetical protein
MEELPKGCLQEMRRDRDEEVEEDEMQTSVSGAGT